MRRVQTYRVSSTCSGSSDRCGLGRDGASVFQDARLAGITVDREVMMRRFYGGFALLLVIACD